MWLLNAMIIAIAMYSKIPMPRVDWNEKNMRYAMCFFPLVGVIIGVLEIVAGNLITIWKGEGTFFYAVVLTLIPVFITGGIHLDGFADTMDAKSSYGDREKKLEILKKELYRLAVEKKAVEQERIRLENMKKQSYSEKPGSAYSTRGQSTMFFRGVGSELALKKRYHPDNLCGDTDTVQRINQEFASLKKKYDN